MIYREDAKVREELQKQEKKRKKFYREDAKALSYAKKNKRKKKTEKYLQENK